jgi:GNAT superfamily N-acetyltransferase
VTVCLPVGLEDLVSLSPEERGEVEELIAECKSADGFDPCMHFDTHLNAEAGMPAWRLAWAESSVGGSSGGRILVGAACVFAPTRSEGEISACVSPVFRRQGIFKSLYGGLARTLSRAGVTSVMIVCEGTSPFGSAIAERLGAALDHGEYRMRLPADRLSGVSAPEGLRLLSVTPGASGEFAAISARVFGEPLRDATDFAGATLADPSRELFVARATEGAVGVAAIARQGDAYEFFGLGVLSELRRRGLGGAILDACLVVLRKRGASAISLEVDAKNGPALALYRSRGFVEESRADYWLLPVPGKPEDII